MKKIFTASLISIAICILLLYVKNQFSCILLAESTYGMPALIKRGSIENLYLGSSMFRQGLDINILDSTTDHTNYILAYNGNQPALEYYELKYLIDNNVEIKNLYVDMYVYSAWEDPELNDEKLLMEIKLPEKWNIWQMISSNLENKYIQTLWRYWVNNNNELLLTWPISSPIINSQFQNGGSLAQTYNTSEELFETPAPAISEKMSPTQEYYIKELIHLSKEHHINLVFIETPKYETIANNTSYLSAMKEYAQLLSDEHINYVVSENTQNKCQLGKTSFYTFNHSEKSYYTDTMHLSYNGRCAFTSCISTILCSPFSSDLLSVFPSLYNAMPFQQPL